jgi:hypothetical protein
MSGSSSQSARQYQDNQHKENQPAKTAPYCRATQVKAASAEQQDKNNQHNQ